MTSLTVAPAFAGVEHHTSHRQLLRTIGSGSSRPPDAIVVSAARPARYLRAATELSSELGCTLIALCSHQAKADEVAEVVAEQPNVRWMAIDLPDDYRHPLLNFETSAVGDVKVRRLGDLSVKRNVGLLLGWLARWSSIMFLDDDISGIDPAVVREAAGALKGGLAMVGLIVHDYPDNSVVCHANRLATRKQDVFVSGSALLVRCDRQGSFFPEVYNEDWLFFFDCVRAGAMAAHGTARQLRYDPFADPGRAVGEEFGDVLAEGLLGLLHGATPLQAATEYGYWGHFLRSRHNFIKRVSSALTHLDAGERSRAALRSLQAAQKRRKEISASYIANYVTTWRRDRRAWIRRLSALDRPGDLESALRVLELDRFAIRGDRPRFIEVIPAGRPQPKYELLMPAMGVASDR